MTTLEASAENDAPASSTPAVTSEVPPLIRRDLELGVTLQFRRDLPEVAFLELVNRRALKLLRNERLTIAADCVPAVDAIGELVVFRRADAGERSVVILSEERSRWSMPHEAP